MERDQTERITRFGALSLDDGSHQLVEIISDDDMLIIESSALTEQQAELFAGGYWTDCAEARRFRQT